MNREFNREVRRLFERRREQLGIRDLRLYDLKAKFVTEKIREGRQEILMEYPGNKTFRRYERPTADDLRALIGVERSRIGNGRFRRFSESRPRI
ncbi:MAG TPA: hypothetical protein VGA73_02570 [Candidatus Binatia bacterium]